MRIAIIGAGASGLAAAKKLLDAGLDCELFERCERGADGRWRVESRGPLPETAALVPGPPQRFGLPRPDHGLFETHPIVNSQLYYAIGHGRVTPKPDVSRFEESRAVPRRALPEPAGRSSGLLQEPVPPPHRKPFLPGADPAEQRPLVPVGAAGRAGGAGRLAGSGAEERT